MTDSKTTAVVPPASPAATTAAAAATSSAAATSTTPKFQVKQHLLSSDGPTKLTFPGSSRMLDVHMIDGRYYLRTVEPIAADEESRHVEIVPAALGSVMSLGDLTPLVVRSGGIHFFAAE